MNKPALPGFALSAGMLWLLAGAMYKLFDGSPNDLPKVVTDISPLSGWETMRAAIIVELAVVGLVIAKPRLGWFFLAGAFGTFLAVLYPLVQAGESSCGCFGSNVTIKPQTMMGIDGGLLALILISRPWRMAKESGLGWSGYLPLLAVAVAAPWMKLTEPALPPAKKPAVMAPAALDARGAGTGTPAIDVPMHVTETMPIADSPKADAPTAPTTAEPITPEVVDPVVVSPVEPAVEPASAPVDVADTTSALPEFFELRPDTWTGVPFIDTDIYRFVDETQGAVLPNSHVVVYRQTCSVCQHHLEQLWEDAQNDPNLWTGERQLVLIRVIENKDATEDNLCTILPEPHQKVSLPALKRGYGITTPMAFDVDENFTVQNVVDLSEH